MTRVPAALLLFLCVAFPAAADPAHDLRLAARSGDLAAVKRLVGDGVAVDAADAWGSTALLLAAKQQQPAVVRYLLDEGADPGVREQFFGGSALDYALAGGEPDYAVAKLLLAAGAPDRATALATALETGSVGLAVAAAASGPLSESEAAEIRRRYPDVAGRLAEILATVRTRPDPPPPSYGEAELAAFAGRYEPPDGEGSALVAVHDGRLVLSFEGKQVALEAFRERWFRNAEEGIVVRYRGRAGTVEGISIERAGKPPLRMRVAETTELATLDLPDPPETAETRATVHWPAFRGDNRDGIGDGRDTPVTFDLASGEGVAWRADLPGLGNSSPVVWGDRVFVTTAVAEGGSTPLRTGLTGSGDEVEEKTEHRWLVLAFDKTTGSKLWETEVGRGVPLTKRHFKSTQANSTPATDGEHVVVAFPTAGLACLGLDGKLHWKHELGGLNAGGFNDPGLQWGFAASPIIHDGKVILQVDIHDGPYLAAWDLDSGKPLWRTERAGIAPSWSTPAIWSTPDGDQLVVNASVIHGYDPDDGRLLWTLGPTSVQVVAAPVVGDPELFVSSGYPPVRPVYAVKPGIEGEHRIDFDADQIDPALVWGLERGGAYMPTPLLYRGLLWIVHHNARVVAHDARTGEPVVRARLSDGGTCTASPVAANGKIYQGTEEGTLYVLEASPGFRELAVHDVGAPLMATPAISQGLLVLRTPGELIALGEPVARADGTTAPEGVE